MTDSLLPLRFSVLRRPVCDIAFAPNTALRKLGGRFREALAPGELVGSLATDAEHLADLCRTDEFHSWGDYPLTRSSATGNLPLDTVKRRRAE